MAGMSVISRLSALYVYAATLKDGYGRGDPVGAACAPEAIAAFVLDLGGLPTRGVSAADSDAPGSAPARDGEARAGQDDRGVTVNERRAPRGIQ